MQNASNTIVQASSPESISDSKIKKLNWLEMLGELLSQIGLSEIVATI